MGKGFGYYAFLVVIALGGGFLMWFSRQPPLDGNLFTIGLLDLLVSGGILGLEVLLKVESILRWRAIRRSHERGEIIQ